MNKRTRISKNTHQSSFDVNSGIIYIDHLIDNRISYMSYCQETLNRSKFDDIMKYYEQIEEYEICAKLLNFVNSDDLITLPISVTDWLRTNKNKNKNK